MGFRAVHNVVALTAQRSLTNTQAMQSRALGRLATGLRINRASDDARPTTSPQPCSRSCDSRLIQERVAVP